MSAATDLPTRAFAQHAARALARAYLRSVSASWRGDADGSGVEAVLARRSGRR
jgi:hypothetical protein